MNYRYIASCVFTRDYPTVSLRIQNYLKSKFEMDIIRCCVDKYKVKIFEDVMPLVVAKEWKATELYKPYNQETTMVSICHNCSAIFQEAHPEVPVMSIWEYILKYDESFPYPDLKDEEIVLQDCWRSFDDMKEQDAVREILKRCNVRIIELEDSRERTKYCGVSTLKPAPPRNFKLAPKRFVEYAPKGFFEPHNEEEQKAYMNKYVKQINTKRVVSYCHYCADGFRMIDQENIHLAEILFGKEIVYSARVN